ncbi:alpha/beta hydrolase fold domain-containing protein [Mycolicibacterium sphagni]|uniref:Alpha/beta hydrolase n=1 Tax=Mycolicibacterium sphagni TaxID=1786 RepID=A0ABX2JZN3_9MYCO|nr:alpha/beta hydrolase [Mycolicibacterium sphagni]
MPLDPDIASIIDNLNAGFPSVHTMTGAQARAAIRARLRPVAEPEPVHSVTDTTVPGPAGEIPVRIYHPKSARAVAVFFHGGGFVFCDLDSHDGLCRSMANGVGAMVISVDYRLAPEHPWPAACNDAYATIRWAATQVPGQPLIVAGDSAGGNLAAVTAIRARDLGDPVIDAQLLLYPVITADFNTPSYQACANGYYNTRAAMMWYWDQYLPDAAQRNHPYASPAHADLSGLSPAVVVTAGFDPLRSEGDSYAQALTRAGVDTVHRCYDGAVHGFMTMPGLALESRAREQAWLDVRAVLGRD